MSNTSLPMDYEARVYAGWLGKCIGVRFGAPIENWTYEEIKNNLGELETYIGEDPHKVFKPDDDTNVPMIFIRAFEDFDIGSDITPQHVADTLLNYIGDEHGTFWWGGYGMSTEHTAYLNLANGIPAPRSGSIAQNGATVAEQIGGQIFSDIWGLIAPNNPKLAADMADAAASVTHGGNGVYGGRFVAALVSAAFSESDPRRLIEIGLEQVPDGSDYQRVIQAMVDFHAQQPDDWHAAFAHLKANFGYDRYGGLVHIIPNAGVIALGLLYGEGDFSETIAITNMCGWDTDCNVGNVGAIMGVAVGLAGIDSKWRAPINDLLIATSVIGTRDLMTLPQCTDLLVKVGHKLAGETPMAPRPRYHFAYPGSTNNFLADGFKGRPVHLSQKVIDGQPALQMAIRKLNKKGEVRLFTRTFYRPSELSSNYYGAEFTPLIFPGQTITATVYVPDDAPETLKAGLFVRDDNHDAMYQATGQDLQPGQWQTLTYTLPELTDACLSEVGIVLRNVGPEWTVGSICLGTLDWEGSANWTTTFSKERRTTDTISQWTRLRGYWRLEDGACAGSGIGKSELYTGDVTWTNYAVEADVVPIIGEHHYINVRVQGALRSYAFGLAPDNTIALYKNDKGYSEVATAPFDWSEGETYTLAVEVNGDTLVATVSDAQGLSQSLTWQDDKQAYLHGQIGLSTWDGSHTRYLRVRVQPID